MGHIPRMKILPSLQLHQLIMASQAEDVWTTLSRWAPKRNYDYDYWWNFTAPQLAYLLKQANYSRDQQWEILMFHYSQMVPNLGPAPTNNPKWKSLLIPDGSPIEYSWKWPKTADDEPEIRYCIEAIGPFSGTDHDPLNIQANRDCLQKISSALPSCDMRVANHFFASLFDHDYSKYAEEKNKGSRFNTSLMIGVDLSRKGWMFKTYFTPRFLGQTDGTMANEKWEAAFAGIHPDSRARQRVHEFKSNDPVGQTMSPVQFAIDNVSPDESRFKWYHQTKHTSFATVKHIMTMGGQIPATETTLKSVKQLIAAVLTLPEDFDENVNMQRSEGFIPSDEGIYSEYPDLLGTYCYYFDIARGEEWPNIKLYIPVRYYGKTDLKIAKGVTSWMQAHGRGAYCDQYMAALENVCQHRPLDKHTGIQGWMSVYMTKNGGIEAVNFMGTEAFDKAGVNKNC